ncbi:MAG: hypothetical protein Q4P08_06675 [Eubacteriales bacterium]|nr:hypothetical protein [Eubacteriales bacterium]
MKIHLARLIESDFDRDKVGGELSCPNCSQVLAVRGSQDGQELFWVKRSMVQTRELKNYRY